MPHTAPTLDWNYIARNLDHLQPVSGGFSQAKRGILELENGQKLFIKIAVDDKSREWLKKEIATYQFLAERRYSAAPKLAGIHDDHTALALPALLPQDGWNWNDEWTEDRLNATLNAMDELASLSTDGTGDLFLIGLDTEADDGWSELLASDKLQQSLLQKLKDADKKQLAETLDFTKEAKLSAAFRFKHDTLAHADERADNCAWNQTQQKLQFVDWNWAQMTDSRIIFSKMLTHVHNSGLDVLKRHKDNLDASALQWLAGFWFRIAAKPIWPGGPAHLRDFQLRAGVTAYQFYRAIT